MAPSPPPRRGKFRQLHIDPGDALADWSADIDTGGFGIHPRHVEIRRAQSRRWRKHRLGIRPVAEPQREFVEQPRAADEVPPPTGLAQCASASETGPAYWSTNVAEIFQPLPVESLIVTE